MEWRQRRMVSVGRRSLTRDESMSATVLPIHPPLTESGKIVKNVKEGRKEEGSEEEEVGGSAPLILSFVERLLCAPLAGGLIL